MECPNCGKQDVMVTYGEVEYIDPVTGKQVTPLGDAIVLVIFVAPADIWLIYLVYMIITGQQLRVGGIIEGIVGILLLLLALLTPYVLRELLRSIRAKKVRPILEYRCLYCQYKWK